MVNLLAWGLSQAKKSMLDSIRAEVKATLRASRSSLATTSLALLRLAGSACVVFFRWAVGPEAWRLGSRVVLGGLGHKALNGRQGKVVQLGERVGVDLGDRKVRLFLTGF